MDFKGLAADEEITDVFFSIPSFPSRSRYSRQQGRGPKVKDQSFLLFIRGSWIRNYRHTFSRLFLPLSRPTTLSSSPFPPFSLSPVSSRYFCHPPEPFPMFDVFPLILPPSPSLQPFSTAFCLKELVLARFGRRKSKDFSRSSEKEEARHRLIRNEIQESVVI